MKICRIERRNARPKRRKKSALAARIFYQAGRQFWLVAQKSAYSAAGGT
jgi:hypothetical protein